MKVAWAELLRQAWKWHGGCAVSVLEIENYQKSDKIEWLLPV